MKELYELKDMLLDKLKEYGKKNDLSSGTLEVIDKLSHATKNLCKIIEDCENEEYSGGYYYDDRSYARGRGRNAKRDAMGRYSRHGADDIVKELHELMEDAPDERTRQEFQRFIQKMEQM